jgi:ankyrin repeat protein
MSFTEQHKAQLDTFWFLLQACRNLLEAVKSGDVNRTKSYVNCTNDSCTTDDENRTPPLKYAALYGHVEVVRVLLEGCANIEGTDVYQSTALHAATWYGHLDVCRLLLDWGAKVDPVDVLKDTPLHDAAWRGYLSVVKLLVERGADVRVKNGRGQTASDMARSWGRQAVAEWLDSVTVGREG